MSEQNEEQLNEIKNRKGKKHNFTELHINRVPDRSVDKLKDLAAEMFANDYGMTLAYLLELHEVRENFDDKLVATNRKVVELEDQVTRMKEMMREDDGENKSKKKDTLQ